MPDPIATTASANRMGLRLLVIVPPFRRIDVNANTVLFVRGANPPLSFAAQALVPSSRLGAQPDSRWPAETVHPRPRSRGRGLTVLDNGNGALLVVGAV